MPTIQEEILRVKELIFGQPKTQTIKECGNMDIDVTEKDHGSSYMAKQQLYNIAKKAQSVHDRLDNGTRLEDWMESKIAQMSDGIDSVTNSFDYDEHEEHEEHNNDEIVTIDLGEQIMAGLQAGYADDSGGDNAYDFESKGALGSQTELGDEGFTEPETNYSKEKKGYNFDSDGPQDSYMDSSDEYNMELGYELGEQEDGGGTGESDDGAGAGTASLGVWESGIARGIANQIATGKWSDSYATTRGKSNPVW
tara:strand:+ start:1260 stop:2015 length:756 start_codon:yes stop_codon:yes gene_type:complete